MTAPFSCPDWLDAHALDDARMGEAYESLSASSRAVLKTCIARLHQIWGESPEQAVSLRCPRQGFCLERAERPADVAVIVCAADYRHPTAFLAALMPAVLAGARAVLPFFVPSATLASSLGPISASLSEPGRNGMPAAPLLAALELAGVERAFVLEEDDVLRFLREVRPEASRLLLLGEKPFAGPLLLHAHEAGLAVRSFFLTPRYWNERLRRVAILSFPAENTFPRRDGQQAECQNGVEDMPVRLGEGHEEFWIWPDLGPDWFRLPRARLFSA